MYITKIKKTIPITIIAPRNQIVDNITLPFSTASNSECLRVYTEYQLSAWQEACKKVQTYSPFFSQWHNDEAAFKWGTSALTFLWKCRHKQPQVSVLASTWIEISPAAPGLPFREGPWPLTSTSFYLWMTVIVRYWLPRRHPIQTGIQASGWSTRHQATTPSLPFWQVLENPISVIIHLLENFFQPAEGAWQVTEVAISYLRSHLYFISIRTNPL